MSDERKEFGIWPWIVALLLGPPVLYVASFGPACWLVRKNEASMLMVAKIYRPLVHTACSDAFLAAPVRWYGDALGAESGASISTT